ncbi:hypothetical protein [uncultured Methylobacterium sp.]|uniref:hypothetical protein n=1 Tax=uncultured Methylobacterium sp. TaxID=157278 RepID=UPI00258BADC5|nr:hypothetical protein [uncultured Methylobacterium sp.]
MSNAPREARSFRQIEADHLRLLATIAMESIAGVTRDGNKSYVYRDRLLLLCLCQGAALHHQQKLAGLPEEECRGIHDFDVWGFFRTHPDRPFPPRWRGEHDLGVPHFGRRPEDGHFVGRKVDVIGRSVDCRPNEDGAGSVLRWVQNGGGSSPRHIRQRPIFVISDGPDFGRMIWPGVSVA